MSPLTHARHVTVTHGMRGYFAVLVWWNPDGGFWEPWESGCGSYSNPDEASTEGRAWAAAEGVEFRPVRPR